MYDIVMHNFIFQDKNHYRPATCSHFPLPAYNHSVISFLFHASLNLSVVPYDVTVRSRHTDNIS